eukprot:14206397-Alexandrium_andersonii.AAC.1
MQEAQDHKEPRSSPHALPPNANGVRAKAGADPCQAPDQSAAAAPRPEKRSTAFAAWCTGAARRPSNCTRTGSHGGSKCSGAAAATRRQPARP